MLWAGFRPLTIYLGTSAVGWSSSKAQEPGSFFSVSSFEAALQALGSQGKFAGRRLDIFLSSGVVRPFLLPLVQGIAGTDEQLQLAHAICSEGTGFEQPAKVWLDPLTQADKRAGRPPLAAAMQVSSWAALHQLIKMKRWNVRSIRPVWTDALALWARSRPPHSPRSAKDLQWMGCVDTDSMTILSGNSAEYSLALTRSTPDAVQLQHVRVRAVQALGVMPENAALFVLNQDSWPASASQASQCSWWRIDAGNKELA